MCTCPLLRQAILWEVTTDLHSSWHFLCGFFSTGKLLCAQWKLPAESSYVASKALSPPVGCTQRPAHLLYCSDEGNPTAPADSTGLRWAYAKLCAETQNRISGKLCIILQSSLYSACPCRLIQNMVNSAQLDVMPSANYFIMLFFSFTLLYFKCFAPKRLIWMIFVFIQVWS